MHSFSTKILALTALLVALSQIATVSSVLMISGNDVNRRARAAVDTATLVFDEYIESRGAQLRQTVRVLASDFGFKEAVSSGDIATIRSALANHARRAGADVAVLLDIDGKVRAATGPGENETRRFAPLAELAEGQGLATAALLSGDHVYQMVTVPLEMPARVGWVSMGFEIRDEIATRLSKLTGIDVSFVADRPGDTVVVASSLERPLRTALAATDQTRAGALQRKPVVDLEGSRFITSRRPMVSATAPVAAILQNSLSASMEPHRAMRAVVLGLGSIAIVSAIFGAYLLARTITRPVQRLVAAARRIHAGDYGQSVPVSTRDEMGELAQAFNAMQDSIAEREAHITHQAHYDSLTGLPNRVLARRRLELLLQGQRPASVIMFGLIAFRELQFSLGHEIAADVLRQVATRIRTVLTADCLLARLEADEFVIVVSGDIFKAQRAAENVVRTLASGIEVQEVLVALRLRVGVAGCPEHGTTIAELLRRASMARSGSCGRSGGICVYEEGTEQRLQQELAIIGDLRRAARDDEYTLHFQPKLDLESGRITGAEALIRWEHPVLGQVRPDVFIGLAERSGNIGLVTAWVLREAVRQLRAWQELGIELSLAVNISAQDLADSSLPLRVMDILNSHEVAPDRLIIEITENALMHDVSQAILSLEYLRDIGVRIAIDDFGTGYSSLSQIRRLPVDEVKIDRAFVMELPENAEDAEIVKTTLHLAHSLDLEVVAEGVESAEGLAWLRRAGCERAQGYHISKPLPALEFLAWLRERTGESAQGEAASADAAPVLSDA